MGVHRLLSALGARLSATTSGRQLEASPGTGRERRAEGRERVALALVLCVATACIGDRERLAPPEIAMEVDSVVRPGASVGVRIVAVDRNSDLASVAARVRSADSVYVQREDLRSGFDSVDVTFGVRVASTALDGDSVEVTGSVINEQLLSRDTVAWAIVRIPPP